MTSSVGDAQVDSQYNQILRRYRRIKSISENLQEFIHSDVGRILESGRDSKTTADYKTGKGKGLKFTRYKNRDGRFWQHRKGTHTSRSQLISHVSGAFQFTNKVRLRTGLLQTIIVLVERKVNPFKGLQILIDFDQQQLFQSFESRIPSNNFHDNCHTRSILIENVYLLYIKTEQKTSTKQPTFIPVNAYLKAFMKTLTERPRRSRSALNILNKSTFSQGSEISSSLAFTIFII